MNIDLWLREWSSEPASRPLLDHVVREAAMVIPCRPTDSLSVVPSLDRFVPMLVHRSSTRTGTLMAALVYLDRLRRRLAFRAKGMPCTCQRIFLATLVVATKVLHDMAPRNCHWSLYSLCFDVQEVNLLESQWLAIMGYQLGITNQDLHQAYLRFHMSTKPTMASYPTEPVLPPPVPPSASSSWTSSSSMSSLPSSRASPKSPPIDAKGMIKKTRPEVVLDSALTRL